MISSNIFTDIDGVPNFTCHQYKNVDNSHVAVLIPVINEGEKIQKQLKKVKELNFFKQIDIIICDAKSTDNSLNSQFMQEVSVTAVLVKDASGKQSAQLRIGFYWAIMHGYKQFITIDGNAKDSVESIPLFIDYLNQGYDFIQGSRFIKGGKAINTPLMRLLAVKLLHAPIISLTAGKRYTDTTNAFRGYSLRYLNHPEVQLFRNIFVTYELLAYLSVRADQLKLKTCEVPVIREYPNSGKIPTKISFFRGNALLIKILFLNLARKYNPGRKEK